MANRQENSDRLHFYGLQNHCRWWLQPWNKKSLAPWKKSYDQLAAADAAKSHQLCPTLYDPTDGSPPGSSVSGILQARILEWVAISFSNAWMWKVKVKSLSRVWLLATPWTAAYQAPPSMGFPSQGYWSGVPLPSPMTNLESILKSRKITFPTKVHLVKAMVFPVVLYGCESWTIKKAEHWRFMLLNCGVGEDSWESLGLQGDSTCPS